MLDVWFGIDWEARIDIATYVYDFQVALSFAAYGLLPDLVRTLYIARLDLTMSTSAAPSVLRSKLTSYDHQASQLLLPKLSLSKESGVAFC